VFLYLLSIFSFFLCVLFSLSQEVREGVEQMWSKWELSGPAAKQGLAASVCPLTLSAGKGLRAGIVAHFNGSEHCI